MFANTFNLTTVLYCVIWWNAQWFKSDFSIQMNVICCNIWVQLIPLIINECVPLHFVFILKLCLESTSLLLYRYAEVCASGILHWLNIICHILIGWSRSSDWQPGTFYYYQDVPEKVPAGTKVPRGWTKREPTLNATLSPLAMEWFWGAVISPLLFVSLIVGVDNNGACKIFVFFISDQAWKAITHTKQTLITQKTPGLLMMHSLRIFDTLDQKFTSFKFVLCVKLTLLICKWGVCLLSKTLYYASAWKSGNIFLLSDSPSRLTFSRWGCYRWCLSHKPSLPTLLFCSCVYFCLYGPFNCISIHKFSQQLSTFLLCSPDLISALLVLLTIYLF